MKFLAIDTSAEHLSVCAYADGKREIFFTPDCARAHSVRLSEEIDGVLKRARLNLRELDFIAVAVGPGSFTGIRIGVATAKGLCLAAEIPALAVTSFDTVAYAEKEASLVLIDAGHGCNYVCGYGDRREITLTPRFATAEETEELLKTGLRAARYADINPAEGLINAALDKSGEAADAENLTALYLRKSSAEEKR